MYEKAAGFWTELRLDILSAAAFITNERPNSSQVWRLYWASHQVSNIHCSWMLSVYIFFFQLFSKIFTFMSLDFFF